MTILQTILLYISTLLVFLGIDAIWLIVISRNFYEENIGHLLAKNPNLISASIFYLIFVAGVIFFATVPAIKEESILRAILNGALFGLITYATYDLTNLATLKDWPLNVTIIDLIWGTFLALTTSVTSYYIATKILNISI